MKDRIYAIDFIRWLLALAIVYFHILHASIIPYVPKESVYLHLRDLSDYAAVIVECFFILSGFFFVKTFCRHSAVSMYDFAKHRFIRLWPVLAFYFIVMLVFFGGSFYQTIYNLAFLQCVGLTADMHGITWYVSPLFWASLFYFALFKCITTTQRRNLVIGIIVYLGYMANMVAVKGGFSRVVVYGIVSLALARALAGMGMGILFFEWSKAMHEQRKEDRAHNGVSAVVCSSIELSSIALLAIDFFYKPLANRNQFIVVIAFSLLLLTMSLGDGVVYRAINRKWLGYLGRYSYSVYVMQSVSFGLLAKIFWGRNKAFVAENPAVTIFFSVMVSTLVGIVVYHLVERPSIRLYAELIQNRRKTT